MWWPTVRYTRVKKSKEAAHFQNVTHALSSLRKLPISVLLLVSVLLINVRKAGIWFSFSIAIPKITCSYFVKSSNTRRKVFYENWSFVNFAVQINPRIMRYFEFSLLIQFLHPEVAVSMPKEWLIYLEVPGAGNQTTFFHGFSIQTH